VSIEVREYSRVHAHTYEVVMTNYTGKTIDHVGTGSLDADLLARKSASIVRMISRRLEDIVGMPLEVEIIGSSGTIKIMVEDGGLLKVLATR